MRVVSVRLKVDRLKVDAAQGGSTRTIGARRTGPVAPAASGRSHAAGIGAAAMQRSSGVDRVG